MRAIAGVDGGHADGIGVTPVHPCLLAAAHDQHPHGRLHMSRADVIAVLPEPAVAHIILPFLQVQQFLQGLGRGFEPVGVKTPDAPDDAFRPDTVEQPPAEAVLLRGGSLAQPEGEAAGAEVPGGVREVVREQGVGEGVAQGTLQGGLPVGQAQHARRRAAAACKPVLFDLCGERLDVLAGDEV